MTPDERAARRAEAAERDWEALAHAEARRAAQTPTERAADDAERERLRGMLSDTADFSTPKATLAETVHGVAGFDFRFMQERLNALGYNLPVEDVYEVTPITEAQREFKRIAASLLYGMSPERIASEHVHTPACDPHFTREEMQAIRDRYFEAYPDLLKRVEEIMAERAEGTAEPTDFPNLSGLGDPRADRF